ncbi:NADH dehydrogenase, alpha subcomplex, subunit 8 [Cylindrobasidium torrendii FP15055 ss-10]|uniref:NADH-ubiquinone oxidoreductase n=1 Tax=Cylindrobasidium torrendii FP15055 ss-10 TaxID=1314674 RepID=A0A0D7BUQ2_9AGAR|nr:NADH dehydrogenase, alpha subcomplex, subunit 8 [Cylindrobasidium torrendii FP15055 ss-10]
MSDSTPVDASSVPKVEEIGATSGPLASASFFIGAHCKDYNEDFMLCKEENRDPAHCLKEGRKVTRCAFDLLAKMRDNCGKQFEEHWSCLEKNNHHYYSCRKPETALNSCMFEKMGLLKTIPGTPQGQKPIHERTDTIIRNVQK